MKIINEQALTPSAAVWLRLRANLPAMISLYFLLFVCCLAVFAYLLMPDNSPNANDGTPALRQKPAGYTCKVLSVERNFVHEPTGWLTGIFMGYQPSTEKIPITHYRISNDTVYYTTAGLPAMDDYILLPDALYAIDMLEGKKDYAVKEGAVTFRLLSGEIKTVLLEKLTGEFMLKVPGNQRFVLGTDNSGRDVLSRLILGARISLGIGLAALVISLGIGTFLGCISGFYGGVTDRVIVWFFSVFWAIPGVMLVIALSLALGSKSIAVAFLAVGLTTWVEPARVVRGQILSVKEKLYVESARSMGFSGFRILFVQILPNIAGPLLVIAASNFATAVLLEAGLSFLGLGAQPPVPTWGSMVNEGFRALGTEGALMGVAVPGLAISLTVLAVNLLGSGIRDALNARSSAL